MPRATSTRLFLEGHQCHGLRPHARAAQPHRYRGRLRCRAVRVGTDITATGGDVQLLGLRAEWDGTV